MRCISDKLAFVCLLDKVVSLPCKFRTIEDDAQAERHAVSNLPELVCQAQARLVFQGRPRTGPVTKIMLWEEG